ncbi:hypothetical protein [Micromonospora sp. U21]|uniref:FIMAH domain-containing protein n=1 Tax=Micromonospora sp. U21 TaxID=2824899 RepID=UPI001B399BFF|nr:hypothetical protein [Micromonospora sp. U21]MBQ0906042.1 hypothetical protein [Micromonospora sp. U21]
MENFPAAGSGSDASQGLTAQTDGTATTAASAAHPFAGPTLPMPPRAVTAAVSSPTVILPEICTRHGWHSRSHTTSDRWLHGLVVAGGAAFAVVLALLAAELFTGGSADRNAAAPVTASPAASTDATPDLTTEPLPPPITTEPRPSPTATQKPRQRPADLIAGIQVGLTQLVRDGQLDEDEAEDLDKWLEESSRALAKGETDKAWDKLREVAEKAGKFRDEGKLTSTGYQALSGALTQLAQTFPPR